MIALIIIDKVKEEGEEDQEAEALFLHLAASLHVAKANHMLQMIHQRLI